MPPSERWLKLTLAYDGTDFAGWQVQPGQRTVQSVLQQVLQKITGEELCAIASGRTDSGVHALGQVVGIVTTTSLAPDVLRRALNAELPEDVAVLSVEPAPEGFHAIRDAVRKLYRYHIHDGRVKEVFRRRTMWLWPTRLDDKRMHQAAQRLVGTHDFSSFESKGAPRDSSVRTIFDLSVVRGAGQGSDEIVIEVEANGFLYNMARAVVGTLVEVGRGARPVEWPAEILARRDRNHTGQTAPPQGLFLVRVEYGGNDEC
jgi:tRNA pseudouridine38-40 synthase